MSQNTIIGLVVAIVVVGGGAWYMSSRSDSDTGGEMSDTGSSTFAELVAQGGSRTCTIAVDTEGSSSKGTVYIADGHMRGDFTTDVNGQMMTAHMIQADGYMYSWTDAAPQGVKVSLSQAQQSDTSQNQGIDPNSKVSYDCSAWVADQSRFDVPSNVTFMELGASGGAAGTLPAGMPTNIPTDQLPYN